METWGVERRGAKLSTTMAVLNIRSPLFQKLDLLRQNLHRKKFALFGYTVLWIFTSLHSHVVIPPCRHRMQPSLQKVPACSSAVGPLALLSGSGNHRSVFCPFSFAFSRISYKWNLTVGMSESLASFGYRMFLRFIHVFAWISTFLLNAEHSSIIRIQHSLFTHWLMGFGIISSFQQL